MNKIIKQAFTLIELLVVIAIIGILSGLIVVSMGGMTTKASIAKSQVFSNSLRNSLMMNLVGQWTFDDIIDYNSTTKVMNSTAGNVPDSWKESEGRAYGGPILNTDCVSGACLYFDGVDDYIDIPSNESLNLGDGNKGTVELWLKVSSWPSSGYPSIVRKGAGAGWTSGSYHISYWGDKMHFVIYSSTSFYNTVDISPPTANAWHHYVLTWSGVSGGKILAYIDGVKNSSETSQTIKADLSPVGNLYFMMGDSSTDYYFNGSLDNVRIYGNSVSTSQIKEHYFTGLNNLLINGSINKEEYLSRINSYASNN